MSFGYLDASASLKINVDGFTDYSRSSGSVGFKVVSSKGGG